MAYNVSALTDYVDANKDELFVKSVAGAKTLEYVDLMPGVKYKEALLFLDAQGTLAPDSCGFNPTASDNFSEKYIEVKPFKYEDSWCWLDVEKKAMNNQIMHQAGRETVAFEKEMVEAQMKNVEAQVEKAVWQGDSTLGIDGFKAQILADSEAQEVSATGTIAGNIDALVASIPATALAKGVDIFMSMTAFRQYVGELNAYCCANRPIQDAAVESLVYAGDSRIRIIPVLGLEGATFTVATSRKNLVVGTDILGAEGVFKLWRDEDSDLLKMRVRSTLGTVVKFGDEVRYVKA